MGRLSIIVKTGLVWVIIYSFIGCVQSPPAVDTKATVESQNLKIDQLTKKLIKSKQANLSLKQAYRALKKENKRLKSQKTELMRANLKLKKYNRELAMKIDMLKVLDHRVEEKRKNYTSD